MWVTRCVWVRVPAPAALSDKPPRQRLSDARRAEQFLNHVREKFAPKREAFRRLVVGINDAKRSSTDDELYGMKVFDARPKYVLRKLAFSIVPVKPR